MIDSFGIRKKYNEHLLISSWEKTVGKTIARHTRSLYVNSGTLYLTIDSAPVKNELHYSREQLLKLINEQFSEPVIHEIVIR